LAALGSSSDVKPLKDAIGRKLAIKYIYCHKVEVAGLAGEMIPAIRTVLYTHEMERFATVSDGVAASVAEIFSIFGMQPYDEKMVLIPERVRTNRGFELLRLTPAMA
jgi:hypothetical protein